jgi:P-type Ca2+ transporter type 2C
VVLNGVLGFVQESAAERAVVLVDDDFATIVAAIREGRRIEDNVRKFLAFLLSANLGEVVLFAVAVLAGLPATATELAKVLARRRNDVR